MDGIKPVHLLIPFIISSFQFAEAQQPSKVARIGFVSARAGPTVAAPDTTANRCAKDYEAADTLKVKTLLSTIATLQGMWTVSQLL